MSSTNLEDTEHNCANCRNHETPYFMRPCVVCLEFRTQYPFWSPK
jgi:hypothetical protein